MRQTKETEEALLSELLQRLRLQAPITEVVGALAAVGSIDTLGNAISMVARKFNGAERQALLDVLHVAYAARAGAQRLAEDEENRRQCAEEGHLMEIGHWCCVRCGRPVAAQDPGGPFGLPSLED